VSTVGMIKDNDKLFTFKNHTYGISMR